MQLRVIGASPAFPNPGGAHAGYLVEEDGRRLLVDCGPGVLSRLRAGALLPVGAIVVTHFHLDHFGDLVPWCWLGLYGPGDGAVGTPLHLPPGGAVTLAGFAGSLGTPGMFERAFALTEYGVRQPFAAAGFEVTAIPVEHYDTPTWGLRVRGPSGRTVAFSADSGPCDALAELARGADLFVCEATLADASADGSLRGHLTLEEAVAAAGETRLLVTHRPSELPVPAARELAREGTVVDV